MGNDLARRVRDNTEAKPGAELEQAAPPSLAKQITNMQDQFAMAMPRGKEAAQLVRDALTCLRMTPKLAECEPTSVLGALMTCAQLGLRPGVLGHAWLLPFWDSRLVVGKDGRGNPRYGGHRAQLVIGYQGLVELAHRSGQITSLVARTVHANDTFDVSYGLDDQLTHKPVLRGERGEPVAYYAVAKFTTGGHVFFVMGYDEMESYRDRYAMARNKKGEIVGPWRDQFEGMALKTTIRQLAKWLPKSTEFASAIEADGSVRLDLTPDPDALLHGEHPDVIDVDSEPDQAASLRTAADPQAWHDAGHPALEGGVFAAWHPDCTVAACTGDQAGKDHFFGHEQQTVEGCGYCQREAELNKAAGQ
jgi:recombination protein RecT